MLRNCFLGLGLALLVVSLAAAQENYVNHGVAGVRGLHAHAVLPPTAIFTNCGTGCTSYDTASGYYLAGSASADGPGQSLAIGFTPSAATKFAFALTPNTNYTSVAGSLAASLLNGTATGGPTTQLRQLHLHGTIPDYPTVAVIKYTSKRPVTLKGGTLYFLCEFVYTSDATMLWMLSNSDFTDPFWFQDSNTCTKPGTTWLNATGSTTPAAEIN
jgi:hypothetical protein